MMKIYARTDWSDIRTTIRFLLPNFSRVIQRLREMRVEGVLNARTVDIQIEVRSVSCFLDKFKPIVELKYLGKVDHAESFQVELSYLEYVFQTKFGELETGKATAYSFQGPDALTGKYIAQDARLGRHRMSLHLHVPWYPDTCTIVEDEPDFKLVCNKEG